MSKLQPRTEPAESRCTEQGPAHWLALGRAVALERQVHEQIEIDLARVWSELTRGRARIIDTFVTERSCHVVIKQHAREEPPLAQLSRRSVQTLERILVGEGRKAIALDHSVNERTVAANATQVLRAIGHCCLLSRLPMPLFTLVHAARGTTDLRTGRVGALTRDNAEYRIISAERVDSCLDSFLSPAEDAVARLLLEGHSHSAIASMRRTARHTIANQLTATFQKLGVSGRAEMLSVLHRDPRFWTIRELRRHRSSQIRTSQVIEGRTDRAAVFGVGAMVH